MTDTALTLAPIVPMSTGLTAADRERTAQYQAASKAAGTVKSYESAWRSFETWCEGRRLVSMPAEPETVAAYLSARADEGMSASRLDATVAAARWQHERSQESDPTSALIVVETIRGVRRSQAGRALKQAHALTVEELRRMLAELDRGTLTGARDAALLLVGFAAALRRSEIAALTVADLDFRPAGLVVRVRSSKSDQEGNGAFVGITRGADRSTDPVSAVRAWLRLAHIDGPNAPVFQKVLSGGTRTLGRNLSGDAVNRIVATCANRAGLDGIGITAHSLRAGHATAATEAGVPASRLARTTRHKNLATLAAYVRPAEVLHDTSASALGL